MRALATKSKPAPTRESATILARSRLPVWLIAVFLLLGTLALYWPAMRCGFVNYDDQDFLTENPHVQGGLSWAGVKWAFCNTEQAAYWAPLMWLSHMVAWQFFGMNAWGHHLTNVLLHAVNTVLVFLVFRRMTGATWRSVILAALFGLHPLRVESVVWVTERKDVLSMLFWILALWAYAKYVEAARVGPPKSNLWYAAALGMFVLGLMSKPVLVVTLPCVLLLLDYWPLRRFESSILNSQPSTLLRLLREKLPFFALAVAASVVTFVVQKQAGALETGQHLPLGARCGNALISYCRYLGKLFWPTNLAVFYPHPRHWPLAQVLLAGGLILGISVLLLMHRRRNPFLLMGWLWFCGTLVPVIQLVQAGGYAMADRFTYVPSLGVLIFVIWGAYQLIRRWHYGVIALSVAGGAAIILFLVLTRHQLGHWKDSETLFRHALAVTKNNGLAHNNLGVALHGKGQTGEAIRQFQKTLRLEPDYADAHYNLGNALQETGQMDEAIRQFQEALRLKPDSAKAHNNLGSAFCQTGQTDKAIRHFQEALRLKSDDALVHNNLGEALGKKGQTDEAIHQYQEALRLKPDYADAYNNLGDALAKKGQIDDAISRYRQAIRLKPADATAHNNLASALVMKGQMDEAIRQFQEALRLKPDYADAHYNLGTTLDAKGHMDEAIRQFQEALRLKPDYADAHYNLGNVLLRKGLMDEAIRQYLETIRLKPADPAAHHNLGLVLARKGQLDEAIAHYQEALAIQPHYAEAHYNLGRVLARKGQWAEAIAHYQQALAIQPGALAAQNNLAWLLATCPQAALRNGAQALALARELDRLSGGKDGDNLDVLAAAYAEAGQFPQAVEAAGRALALAVTQTNLNAVEIRARLKLYQNRSPYHEPPPNP